MSDPSLLAFFAHPDDEAFSCAGTLAAATDLGVGVSVVCATRGERGGARDGSQADLALRRTEELGRSCRALGARPPVFLDLPDGELDRRRDTLKDRLGGALRQAGAVAVITFGPDGAYGHVDHLACTEALSEVIARVDRPPSVLHVVFPPGLFDGLRRRLRRSPVPLATRTRSALPADYVVDIRPFEQRKLSSIAAHGSQLEGGDPRSFLSPGLVERLLAEECFRLAAGRPLDDRLARLFRAR